jgi:hypothetical protein
MKAILIAISLLAALAVAQADVGLVVLFPDGEVYTKCVKADGQDGYGVMQKSGLSLEWSHYAGMGYSLDKINGIGPYNPDTGEFWNLYSSINSEYWSLAFEGVSSLVFNHGDRMGWSYAEWDSAEPPNIPFEEICPPKAARTRAISRISEPFWKKYCEECGIEYDYTIPPQSLSLMCFNKKREDKERACAAYNLSLSDTGLGFEHPEYLRSINEGLSLGFSYGGRAIVNLTVLVNGQAHFTNETGNIWFEITPSDYLIEVSDDCVGEFKKIIRISA